MRRFAVPLTLCVVSACGAELWDRSTSHHELFTGIRATKGIAPKLPRSRRPKPNGLLPAGVCSLRSQLRQQLSARDRTALGA